MSFKVPKRIWYLSPLCYFEDVQAQQKLTQYVALLMQPFLPPSSLSLVLYLLFSYHDNFVLISTCFLLWGKKNLTKNLK